MRFQKSCAEGRRIWGFTLIELVVTLAILTLLTVIGVPGVMGLVRDARLSSNTDMLVNALNSARMEAVKRRRDVKVCPVADPNADSTCVADAALWSAGLIVREEPSGTVIQRVVFGQGVTVTTEEITVDINATLGSSAALATFQLCATGRRQQEVEIALSGHVKKTLTATLCL